MSTTTSGTDAAHARAILRSLAHSTRDLDDLAEVVKDCGDVFSVGEAASAHGALQDALGVLAVGPLPASKPCSTARTSTS